MREAVIVEALRTPVGRKAGAYENMRSDELLAVVLRELVERTGIDPAIIGDVICGCVTQTSEQGSNIGRLAVLATGWPVKVPACSVNRMCGSSEETFHMACSEVIANLHDIVIAAGTESMTRVPMGSDVGSFSTWITDRFELVNQGISAELIAEKWGISRTELDEFSLESHRKALHAQAEGRFDKEIVPVQVGDNTITKDEGPRADTTLEKMATLKPAFKPDGVITAASASQISDGASAIMVMSKEKAEELGLKPRARFVAGAVTGVDPTIMLTGPIPATRMVLEKANLTLGDIDLVEINEAFASVVLAWAHDLEADMSKVNVNGGAVALGHPLGATGARLLTTMLHELERQDLRYGLQTMCIGFGLGIATIIERIE